MNTDKPLLLTLGQVAELIGCKSEAKVRGLINSGELDSIHCGRHHRVRYERLLEYLDRLETHNRHTSQRSTVNAVKSAGRKER